MTFDRALATLADEGPATAEELGERWWPNMIGGGSARGGPSAAGDDDAGRELCEQVEGRYRRGLWWLLEHGKRPAGCSMIDVWSWNAGGGTNYLPPSVSNRVCTGSIHSFERAMKTAALAIQSSNELD